MPKSLFPRFTVAVLLLGGTLASRSEIAIAQQTADAKKAPAVVAVFEADNGKDIDLTAGQTLRIKLKTIAGTGYAWSLSGDPAPLKLTKTSTQRSKNQQPGAAQMSVFDLTASSAGLANVTFVYRRSWEYNVAPVKTFTIRVNVR